MKIENQNQLKIKLKGTKADDFKSALKKISIELKQAGFKRINLSADEQKVITDLTEKL